jgi:molybdate transport system substrate-binding protein
MARLLAMTLTLATLAASVPSHAAELNVIAAGATRGVLRDMLDDYTKQTGQKFSFTIGPTGQLRDAIASGKPTDLVITSSTLMAELEKTGKLTPDSRVDIGRLGMGVVIRDGSPVPDISTPEAVRKALIDAPSIAHTDPKLGGTSFIHLMKIAERFGIKDDVLRKGVPATGGDDAAAKVAIGEAAITLVLVSEIHAKDAKLVGLLPEPIQLWTVYSAAIPRSSADPEAARKFIAALTGPSMHDRWIAAGWQPLK